MAEQYNDAVPEVIARGNERAVAALQGVGLQARYGNANPNGPRSAPLPSSSDLPLGGEKAIYRGDRPGAELQPGETAPERSGEISDVAGLASLRAGARAQGTLLAPGVLRRDLPIYDNSVAAGIEAAAEKKGPVASFVNGYAKGLQAGLTATSPVAGTAAAIDNIRPQGQIQAEADASALPDLDRDEQELVAAEALRKVRGDEGEQFAAGAPQGQLSQKGQQVLKSLVEQEQGSVGTRAGEAMAQELPEEVVTRAENQVGQERELASDVAELETTGDKEKARAAFFQRHQELAPEGGAGVLPQSVLDRHPELRQGADPEGPDTYGAYER